jgi:hypothetical protein
MLALNNQPWGQRDAGKDGKLKYTLSFKGTGFKI